MKKNLYAVLAFVMMMAGVKVCAQNTAEKGKVLVAYFSWSGNTRVVAEQIAGLTGGTLHEIQTVEAYPKEYRPCTEVAKKERDTDARPKLKGKVRNMGDYDVVFVGFPNWWGTAPMAVWTFLEGYDWQGKTVIPFCTHGGGGEQNCFSDFVKHKGKAQTKKGFIVSGGLVNEARPKVEKWLGEIKMK